MKEKYFGRIKTIGILLSIFVFVMCICPWKDSFPVVGVPYTVVSYYRTQTAEEIKTSTKIGKSLSSSMEEADFRSLVATASLAIREQGIEKWNKKAQKEWIPTLIDGTDVGNYESAVGRDNLEDLLEEIMIKESAKFYRNGGVVRGKEVTSTGDNDLYLSLVIMSLGIFIALLCIFKYDKNSKMIFSVGFVIASGVVKWAYNVNSMKLLERAFDFVSTDLKGVGHSYSLVSMLFTIIGYLAVFAFFVYALLVLLTEIDVAPIKMVKVMTAFGLGGLIVGSFLPFAEMDFFGLFKFKIAFSNFVGEIIKTNDIQGMIFVGVMIVALVISVVSVLLIKESSKSMVPVLMLIGVIIGGIGFLPFSGLGEVLKISTLGLLKDGLGRELMETSYYLLFVAAVVAFGNGRVNKLNAKKM